MKIAGSFPNPMVIVDVETTGMSAFYGRIIDIAVIRIEDGEVVKTYQSFLNPDMPLSRTITDITGITDDDLLDAPSFDEIAPTLLELFSGATFVAHNASFDYGFIKQEFKHLGIPFRATCLCSVRLSRALFPRYRSNSLDALIARYGFTITNRHRAMPDAEIILKFFNYLTETVGEDILQKKINACFSDSFFSTHFGRSAPVLPEGSGVYSFYGKDDELLYIGKSKNIKARVRSHFSSGSRRLTEETKRIETITTPGELSALLLEAHRIKTETPLVNRASRKIKRLVVATIDTNPKGYTKLTLSFRDAIAPGEQIFAIFKTKSQAKEKLLALGDEYNLCHVLLDLEKSSSACFRYGLESCAGACIGKETSLAYNARFEAAFRTRRIKTWPYSGGIVVTEAKSPTAGVQFFVKDWCLHKSIKYDGDLVEDFIPGGQIFDHDVYKILAKYISMPRNQHTIKTYSAHAFETALSSLTGRDETVVEWS